MIVVAQKIINPDHSIVHWDLMTETCRSFESTLINKDNHKQSHLKNIIVALRHDKGAYLEDIDTTNIGTVLVGCDDSDNNDWLDAGVAVRIRTPVDYYLWSGVALGIFLHHLHISSQKNKT